MQIFGTALQAWWDDDPLRLGAALAYYAEHRGIAFEPEQSQKERQRTESAPLPHNQRVDGDAGACISPTSGTMDLI